MAAGPVYVWFVHCRSKAFTESDRNSYQHSVLSTDLRQEKVRCDKQHNHIPFHGKALSEARAYPMAFQKMVSGAIKAEAQKRLELQDDATVGYYTQLHAESERHRVYDIQDFDDQEYFASNCFSLGASDSEEAKLEAQDNEENAVEMVDDPAELTEIEEDHSNQEERVRES